MDNLKTEYPEDIINDFPITLEDLSWLSMQYGGAGRDGLILRARIRLVEQQAKIKARSLAK